MIEIILLTLSGIMLVFSLVYYIKARKEQKEIKEEIKEEINKLKNINNNSQKN